MWIYTYIFSLAPSSNTSRISIIFISTISSLCIYENSIQASLTLPAILVPYNKFYFVL